MVEIGGQPILWHIMMIYSHFGLTDFIICLGYKSYSNPSRGKAFCLLNS
jgi:glucose-1-phosphate cytidylyltransferase